jgi:hypothetical protein
MKHLRKRRVKKSERYRKKGGGLGLTTKSSVGIGPFKNLFGRGTRGQTAVGSKEKCYSFMGKEFGCKREENNEPLSQKTASIDATATTAAEPTEKSWYKFWGGRKTRKRRRKRRARTRRVYR